MIRINLLSEGRRPVVARKAKASLSLGGQDPNNILIIAGCVLGALVVGAWWYRLNSEFNEMQRRVRAAQVRYDELRPIIKQVDDFKKNSEDLERKVEIIKDLKRKQEGPVHVMDMVSRSIPELLWLDDMSVVGTTLSLRGKAFNTNAVAAFIENLGNVAEFEEPDPKNIQIGGRAGTEVYNFQMTISIKPMVSEEEEAAEAS